MSAINIGNIANATFKVGSSDCKVYLGNTLLYSPTPPTPTGQTPQFAVVPNIQSYTATTFNKVYSTTDNKWYMLNNLNQYEEYGIYDVSGSSLSDYTYYDGKLVAIGTTEYQYSGNTWVEVGTYEDVSVTYTIDDSDPSPYIGQELSTTFKIPYADVESVGIVNLRISTNDGYLQIELDTGGWEEYTYQVSGSYEGTVTNDGEYFYLSLPSEAPQSIVIDSVNYWDSTPIHLIVGSKQISVEYTDIDKPFGVKSFSSMTEAESYNDVYYGLAAHIGNDDYVYTTANTWSQVIQTQANYFRVKTSTVGLDFTNKASSGSLYVSYDLGNNWYETNSLLAVDSGNTVMFKGNLNPTYGNSIGRFSNNVLEVEGNIMSLLYGDNFIGQTDLSGKNYVFYGLFSDCTTLTSAENMVLPATTLAANCYGKMFNGCTSLTTVPSNMLPATTLASSCYNYMFQNCTSLTSAPELPATTLASSCYQYMFSGCTSLTSITCLATNISAISCTFNWVYGVAASGTFTKAANMSGWGSCGKSKIPCGWTVEDATS